MCIRDRFCSIYFNPMATLTPVFTGLTCSESLITALFSPKLKLDPPTKIILGSVVYLSNESFCLSEKRKEPAALGVGGKNNPDNKNKVIGIKKNNIFFKKCCIEVRTENK